MVKQKDGKTVIGNTEISNRPIRKFLRILSAIALVFYLGYFMYSKVVTGSPNLNYVDGLIIFFAVAVLITIESVRAYAKRKLEKMDK